MPSAWCAGTTGPCGAHHANACAVGPRARVVGDARGAAAAVSRAHVAASGRGIGSQECCRREQGDGGEGQISGRPATRNDEGEVQILSGTL